MTSYLEFTIDKFTFRIADDRDYSEDGLWAKVENSHVRIGLSDYLQQRSGDVAFIEVMPEGALLAAGEELAVIETIKVNISITSPVAGKVIAVNPILEKSPEVINQDPYGTGWLAVIEPEESKPDTNCLLDPRTYFSKIRKEAEQELDSK